ncbi:MAG: hypothetical protein LRY43_03135, partial [Gammaproteobacteria bacterium]|nr:hypothetical protein [Gammaproteobacteria bacterium]
HNATLHQLDDHKKENARLHQLANNIQSNLEHYQNSMQQIRTEQQLANEKQQAQFQQQIQLLQQELIYARQQSQQFESELDKVKIQRDDLQAIQTELTQKNQQQAHELVLLTEYRKTSVQKIQLYENDLLVKNSAAIELEKQIAVLTEKKKKLEHDLHDAQDKVTALRQEKLFLAQEKAELQGALKQLGRLQS